MFEPYKPDQAGGAASPNAGLPGFLTFDQWMRPAQAKWFKKQHGMNMPQDTYAQWLEMLRQRASAPAPNQVVPNPSDGLQAPPPRGGRGRGGGRGGQQSAAGPGAGNKPWVNPDRPAGANNSFRPTGKPGIPNQQQQQGNPFVPGGQPPPQWGNKGGSGWPYSDGMLRPGQPPTQQGPLAPAPETFGGAQQSALAMIANLLRNQGQYRSAMGGKG